MQLSTLIKQFVSNEYLQFIERLEGSYTRLTGYNSTRSMIESEKKSAYIVL